MTDFHMMRRFYPLLPSSASVQEQTIENTVYDQTCFTFRVLLQVFTVLQSFGIWLDLLQCRLLGNKTVYTGRSPGNTHRVQFLSGHCLILLTTPMQKI